MAATPLPVGVRRFLDRHIDSIVQIEILLALRRRGACTAEEIARELRINVDHCHEQAGSLVPRLLAHDEDGYRYEPEQRLRSTAEELAALYETHRVAITSAIYSKTAGPIRDFSAAFKLRKDRNDG